MEHTISITFDEADIATGVFLVRLATPDPSFDAYGVKNVTDDTVTVPWGTEVAQDPDGTYSHTFTVENGKVYNVSWEIFINENEVSSFRTYQVGPFYSINNDNIRAVSSFSGKFAQGTFATLMLKVTNFDGNPVDVEDIYIEIYNEEAGTIVTLDNNIPEHVDKGFYVIDWLIPVDQTEGEHRVIWHYKVDDIQKAEIQNIIISEKSADTDAVWYSGREREFKIALEHYLACSQSIPVYFEQARPSRDSKVYHFSFKNWNQSPGIRIYRNDLIVNSGVEVDYFEGTVTFDTALLPQETVFADYNFKWFSDDQLLRSLLTALQIVNTYPPHSGYLLSDIPERFSPALLYGAASDALRQLMMCINHQQPAQVFGGIENAQKAFSNFETLKQNYEKDWEKLLEQKKLGPYPKTRLVVTPEYTLPGGRSRWFRYLFKG